MRRAIVSILLFLAVSSVVAAPAPLSKAGRTNRGPSEAQILEERRALIAFIRPGMTHKQVVDMLGPPSSFASFSAGGGFRAIESYRDLGITVVYSLEGVLEVRRRPAP